MLSIEELEVQYGAVLAVTGVSLELGVGEVIGLLGPNGVGKSSTLNGIVGLVRARALRLSFNGEDIASLSAEQRIRRGIALVPQGRQLFPNLSVADNIRTGMWSLHRTRSGRVDLGLLDFFPQLKGRMSQRAGSLSGGEQQICAIARAVVSRPRLLLLDEPSMGLSPKVLSSVIELIKTVNQETKAAMIVVEQGAGAISRLTSRILVMHGGRVVSESLGGTDVGAEQLAQSYFGINVEDGED